MVGGDMIMQAVCAIGVIVMVYGNAILVGGIEAGGIGSSPVIAVASGRFFFAIRKNVKTLTGDFLVH